MVNDDLVKQFYFYDNIYIIGFLRQKDKEQAVILEEKMGLQLKLLASAGVETLPVENPSYCHLVTEHQDSEKIRKEVMNAIQVIITYTVKNLFS